jgi:hypothetical protein
MSTQKTDVRDSRRKHLDALCNEHVDMSKTPRTDDGCFVAVLENGIFCKPSVARQLETELIAMTANYEALQSEALKTITALTAERDKAQERVAHLNAELKRLNEWHPASEPPNNGRLVLLMIGENMYIGRYDHDENMWRDSDVTQWRELPAPPQEVKS